MKPAVDDLVRLYSDAAKTRCKSGCAGGQMLVISLAASTLMTIIPYTVYQVSVNACMCV